MLLEKLAQQYELVFFRDSNVHPLKQNTWATRQAKRQDEFMKVLAFIKRRDNSLKSVLEKFANNSWYMKSMMAEVDETCTKFGKIFHSVVSA